MASVMLPAALLLDGWPTVVLAAAGGGAAATFVMRLWCRRVTSRALQAVTWSATRQRVHEAERADLDAERWRAIVDTATEGICTIDERGSIETVNGAIERMFGYRRAELLGQNVRLLMPDPYATEHDGYMRRYIETGERRIIGIGREVLGRRKDGSVFPIDLSVGEGTAGGRRFFTGVIRDITERHQMQTKLGQAERLAAIGELAAGVAHEINNPINTIINCAQLVLDGDDAAENARVVVEEGARIADIVQNLLQFARDDRDRTQPTSLGEAVQRTRRLLGENWLRHGIELTVDVPTELPLVRARPQQMQQVLLNLLINAKDALVESGKPQRRVTITARVLDHGVRLTVADNGPGLAPDIAARLFDPFATTKRGRGGTGLGLSISKSIVEGYGGSIDVESRPGEGATFVVWLPIAEPD
jgi:two-component system, LuxR family, sensor kinase FixL